MIPRVDAEIQAGFTPNAARVLSTSLASRGPPATRRVGDRRGPYFMRWSHALIQACSSISARSSRPTASLKGWMGALMLK